MQVSELTGDTLVRVLAALANPHRVQVIASLTTGRKYVSQLARELGISRPLTQVHLRRLEAVGLVSSTIEVSADGKAMKFYTVETFGLDLTPATLATAARTLGTAESDHDGKTRGDT